MALKVVSIKPKARLSENTNDYSPLRYFFLFMKSHGNSSLIIGMSKNSMKQNEKHFLHLDII